MICACRHGAPGREEKSMGNRHPRIRSASKRSGCFRPLALELLEPRTLLAGLPLGALPRELGPGVRYELHNNGPPSGNTLPGRVSAHVRPGPAAADAGQKALHPLLPPAFCKVLFEIKQIAGSVLRSI